MLASSMQVRFDLDHEPGIIPDFADIKDQLLLCRATQKPVTRFLAETALSKVDRPSMTNLPLY